jgi:hypothetical protein
MPTRARVDTTGGMFSGENFMSARTPPRKPGHNPYQGYALLAEGDGNKMSEEERRAEVSALYKQRVLGQRNVQPDPDQ